MNRKITKAIDFDNYLKEELKNPEFKRLFDEYGRQLEVAYQIIKLRKKVGLSQTDLAKRIGTKQSNIARIEAGGQNLSINLLDKIAIALNAKLTINLQ